VCVFADRFYREGGIPALSKLYPWHPALAPKIDEDTFAAIDFAVLAANDRPTNGAGPNGDGQHPHGENSMHGHGHHPGGGGPGGAGGGANNAKSASILVSLADQQWLSAADAADAKFEAAKVKTDRMVHDVVATTKKHISVVNSQNNNMNPKQARVSPTPSQQPLNNLGRPMTLMDAVEESVARVDVEDDDGSRTNSTSSVLGASASTVDLLDAIKDASINTIGGDINDIIAEEEEGFDDDDTDEDSDESDDTEYNNESFESTTSKEPLGSPSQRGITTDSAREKELEENEGSDNFNSNAQTSDKQNAPDSSKSSSSKQAAPRIGNTSMSFHASKFLTDRVLKAEKSSFGFGNVSSPPNPHTRGSPVMMAHKTFGKFNTEAVVPTPKRAAEQQQQAQLELQQRSTPPAQVIPLSLKSSNTNSNTETHTSSDSTSSTRLPPSVAAAVRGQGNDSPLVMIPFPRQPGHGSDKDKDKSSGKTVQIVEPVGSHADGGGHRHTPPSSLLGNILPSAAAVPPMQRGSSLAVLLQRGASIRSNSRRTLLDSSRRGDRDSMKHVEALNSNVNALPAYFRGGISVVKGLDTLLGNALSLLYVSRHGLKEPEMWALLGKHSNDLLPRVARFICTLLCARSISQRRTLQDV
jgi:hypothetical protein